MLQCSIMFLFISGIKSSIQRKVLEIWLENCVWNLDNIWKNLDIMDVYLPKNIFHHLDGMYCKIFCKLSEWHNFDYVYIFSVMICAWNFAILTCYKKNQKSKIWCLGNFSLIICWEFLGANLKDGKNLLYASFKTWKYTQVQKYVKYINKQAMHNLSFYKNVFF